MLQPIFLATCSLKCANWWFTVCVLWFLKDEIPLNLSERVIFMKFRVTFCADLTFQAGLSPDVLLFLLCQIRRLCELRSTLSALYISLFSDSSRLLNIYTHARHSHTPKNNRLTTESFHTLSQGSGLSQELSTTSNLNLFPPSCEPRVYTGLGPGSRFSWQWLVVTHTLAHMGGMLKWFPCIWSLEIVVAVRAFLLSRLLCTYPPVFVVHAWAPGASGGGPLIDLGVLWFWRGMCCVSGLV